MCREIPNKDFQNMQDKVYLFTRNVVKTLKNHIRTVSVGTCITMVTLQTHGMGNI